MVLARRLRAAWGGGRRAKISDPEQGVAYVSLYGVLERSALVQNTVFALRYRCLCECAKSAKQIQTREHEMRYRTFRSAVTTHARLSIPTMPH